MDKDYTLTAVSGTVKSWDSAYGPMVTYRVKFEETGDEVFELNKKQDSPAPQVSQVLFGHLEDSKNPEFPTRKFKSASKAFPSATNTAPGGTWAPKTSYQESPEKQASIYRSVALNNACTIYQGSGESVTTVLTLAEDFNVWLENKEVEDEVKDEPKEKGKFDFDKPVSEDDFGGEPVDISTIPF